MMKGVVVNPFFDWAGDRQPKTPYSESFIYEAHVKGLTELHPADSRGDPRHVQRASRTPRSSTTSRSSA